MISVIGKSEAMTSFHRFYSDTDRDAWRESCKLKKPVESTTDFTFESSGSIAFGELIGTDSVKYGHSIE